MLDVAHSVYLLYVGVLSCISQVDSSKGMKYLSSPQFTRIIDLMDEELQKEVVNYIQVPEMCGTETLCMLWFMVLSLSRITATDCNVLLLGYAPRNEYGGAEGNYEASANDRDAGMHEFTPFCDLTLYIFSAIFRYA